MARAVRSFSRKLAYYITAAALLIWLIGGARLGFFHTTEDIKRIEPITEIEYTETRAKFSPGIEFPVIGILMGASLWLTSFLLRKPSPPITPERS